ncbi:unnamed protein product [Trichogramma brassicae]|uniref:Uncharacterized protein n=1 Tax=Trichogramma brassicae TaxID=86971 RepID=A0A6H5I2P3_9HYME|nr:unnamed protein product [Trichogramma brassicae]
MGQNNTFLQNRAHIKNVITTMNSTTVLVYNINSRCTYTSPFMRLFMRVHNVSTLKKERKIDQGQMRHGIIVNALGKAACCTQHESELGEVFSRGRGSHCPCVLFEISAALCASDAQRDSKRQRLELQLLAHQVGKRDEIPRDPCPRQMANRPSTPSQTTRIVLVANDFEVFIESQPDAHVHPAGVPNATGSHQKNFAFFVSAHTELNASRNDCCRKLLYRAGSHVQQKKRARKKKKEKNIASQRRRKASRTKLQAAAAREENKCNVALNKARTRLNGIFK